jgi:hypothetical protein
MASALTGCVLGLHLRNRQLQASDMKCYTWHPTSKTPRYYLSTTCTTENQCWKRSTRLCVGCYDWTCHWSFVHVGFYFCWRFCLLNSSFVVSRVPLFDLASVDVDENRREICVRMWLIGPSDGTTPYFGMPLHSYCFYCLGLDLIICLACRLSRLCRLCCL